MSLDDIWDEPVASVDVSARKRTHQSLFFSDSDSDYARPPKRATPAQLAHKPDVGALFDELDREEQVDDLRYKPLTPALDLAKLAKEAEERHARAGKTGTSRTLTGNSKTEKNQPAIDQEKGKPADGEKTGRRVLPKLDEERLVGPEGFPLLIQEIKGFKPKGKGNEHADLNRLLQVYQFWAHRMYPKTPFKDTINRVEKLCHSKRMQVRLSVWHDEFKGVTDDKKSVEDSNIIDLTEPTLVGTEQDRETHDIQLKSDQGSSPPSLPPASSEVEDDDFDIDAVIRAEEERLSALRATTTDSVASPPSLPPTVLEKALSKSDTDMDLDEASLWDAIGNPPESDLPPPAPHDEDDMWDIVDQMEQGGPSSKPVAKLQIPVSGVNLIPSLNGSHSGESSRATNEEDWDEMYS